MRQDEEGPPELDTRPPWQRAVETAQIVVVVAYVALVLVLTLWSILTSDSPAG